MVSSSNGKTVISLVNNHCTSDARVLKEAKSLADNGYDVTIYARSTPSADDIEERDGFKIIRFDCYKSSVDFSTHIADLSNLFKLEANTVSERGTSYVSLQKQLEHLRRLNQEIKKALHPRARLTGFLSKYKSFNRFKASISSIFTPHPTSSSYAYEETYDLILKHIQNERSESYFYINYYLYCANLLRLDFKHRPDVIHSHDLYTLPAAVALKEITGAKLVYDAHELEAERAPPLPSKKKNFILNIENNLLHKVDRMITVSKSIASVYESKGILKQPPTLVLNAPEINFRNLPHSSSIDIRANSNLKTDTPLIVYTGGIGKEGRGLDKVVSALALIREFHLVIIGPANASNTKWLLEVANKENVTERIHFLPPVKHDQVVEAIRHGDIGIISLQNTTLNHLYAMPNKLFEMSFAGLPLCVSDLTEIANFVGKNNIGVTMDQTDPSSIASAIQTVYNNKSDYTLGKDALSSLIEQYGWQAQSSALIELYDDL